MRSPIRGTPPPATLTLLSELVPKLLLWDGLHSAQERQILVTQLYGRILHAIADEQPALLALLAELRTGSVTNFAHALNVSVLATMLGYHAGLPTAQILQLAFSGLFQDNGMVAVPAGICNSPHALSAEEQPAIREHVVHTLELQGASSVAEQILAMIYQHHQQPDGAGYPVGLHEPQISSGARLQRVCDVYDALAADRPQRPCMTASAVEREMQVMSGPAAPRVRTFLAAPATLGSPTHILHCHQPRQGGGTNGHP